MFITTLILGTWPLALLLGNKTDKMACKSRLNLGIDSGLPEPGLEALEDGHNDLQLGFRQLAVLRPGVWGWGGH